MYYCFNVLVVWLGGRFIVRVQRRPNRFRAQIYEQCAKCKNILVLFTKKKRLFTEK